MGDLKWESIDIKWLLNTDRISVCQSGNTAPIAAELGLGTRKQPWRVQAMSMKCSWSTIAGWLLTPDHHPIPWSCDMDALLGDFPYIILVPFVGPLLEAVNLLKLVFSFTPSDVKMTFTPLLGSVWCPWYRWIL